MTLAKRIRDCRYAKGWGPDELAQKADISRTALYQIECGKTETPRAGTIRRIARALDVPVERLLGTEESEAAEGASPRREVFVHPATVPLPSVAHFGPRDVAPARETEILLKVKEILESPLGEGLSRIVEESHRLIRAH